jgi:hypothetical protein
MRPVAYTLNVPIRLESALVMPEGWGREQQVVAGQQQRGEAGLLGDTPAVLTM